MTFFFIAFYRDTHYGVYIFDSSGTISSANFKTTNLEKKGTLLNSYDLVHLHIICMTFSNIDNVIYILGRIKIFPNCGLIQLNLVANENKFPNLIKNETYELLNLPSKALCILVFRELIIICLLKHQYGTFHYATS